MNYELALKLKEAGFPQLPWPEALYYVDPHTVGVWGSFNRNIRGENGEEVSIDQFVKRPTLLELIMACGEKFWRLEKSREYWFAYENETGANFAGMNPEEAVGTLWLALHEENQTH